MEQARFVLVCELAVGVSFKFEVGRSCLQQLMKELLKVPHKHSKLTCIATRIPKRRRISQAGCEENFLSPLLRASSFLSHLSRTLYGGANPLVIYYTVLQFRPAYGRLAVSRYIANQRSLCLDQSEHLSMKKVPTSELENEVIKEKDFHPPIF